MKEQQEKPIQSVNFREEIIKNELSAYDLNIEQYRYALQYESAFLFLAVLGCWSITGNKYIQIFAFGITFMFFTIQVYRRLSSKKSFRRFELDIERQIKKEFIAGPLKDGYTKQLDILNSKRSSHAHIFKNSPMFFVCTAFYVWSIYDQVNCDIISFKLICSS